jgi:hypothetical protein
MSENKPLIITLDDLNETDLASESPAIPEPARSKAREGLDQAGQKVAGVLKDSTARVTHKVADTTADVANRTAEAVRDKVSEAIQAQSRATAEAVEARLREIDWQTEAKKGAESGLRRFSKTLEALAERLRADGTESKQ